MLTSKAPPKYNNILLKKEHFKEAFEFKPDNSPTSKSYIAPLYLLKDIKFEHLEKVGEFTEEGINFIKENLSKLTYTDWSTYLKSVK